MRARVLLLILLLVAAKLLYDAGAPSPVAASAATAAAATAGADEPADTLHDRGLSLAGGLGVLGRLWHGVGVYGAHLAEPAVLELLETRPAELAELQAAAQKTPEPRRRRAQGSIRRIEQLDSLALSRVQSGNPVAALKFAMQAGGLVETMRKTLAEEALSR